MPPEPLDKTARIQADYWPTQRLGSVWSVLPLETRFKPTRPRPPSPLDTSFRSAFAVLKSTVVMLDLPPHIAQIYLCHAQSPSSCLNLPYRALICLFIPRFVFSKPKSFFAVCSSALVYYLQLLLYQDSLPSILTKTQFASLDNQLDPIQSPL